jgi:hypothetical protein
VIKYFVIDANVPVVANGKSRQADESCVISCIEKLSSIYEQGVVVLDDGMLILKEYMNNLSLSGQPGLGNIFMKWIWTVQANPKFCKQVHITPRHHDRSNFNEFPDNPELRTFDPSDRKYAAVALVNGKSTELLNAVDSDWAEHYYALKQAGITICFLCPQHVCAGV